MSFLVFFPFVICNLGFPPLGAYPLCGITPFRGNTKHQTPNPKSTIKSIFVLVLRSRATSQSSMLFGICDLGFPPPGAYPLCGF